ncbi:hypothetical protein [Roseisolibacter sp. H3M3-2]|uniref:hypothetical protein n=1 Tax=Roseisolibacter sp. H3M3-2 TaxID=3031323 RepID=UPI0023DC0820|nr:hypothetical protein [Roseisolibacter sp. H3M3-2]MDF1504017.1 hypothetical protein [Roseisolibacter sp. H3M3-2]
MKRAAPVLAALVLGACARPATTPATNAPTPSRGPAGAAAAQGTGAPGDTTQRTRARTRG